MDNKLVMGTTTSRMVMMRVKFRVSISQGK